MKGYTIQNSIELLEKKAGSGSGGASTAAEVSFDNTGTGLAASNVQSAISEVNSKSGLIYSSSEFIAGKWFDDVLYGKTFEISALASTGTSTQYAHGITDTIKAFKASAIDSNGVVIPLPFYSTAQNYNIGISVNATNVTVETQRDSSTYHAYITLYYTKAASEAKTTRKKSSK